MHVSALKPEMFQIHVDGRPAILDDAMPDFGLQDRVGVVVRTPYGGLGASYLFTSAMVRFYTEQKMSGEVYPDYFLFAVGQPQGDHSMLDLWPPHHDVTVDNDAEKILQAVNDRGITRLLVETTATSSPEVANWTRESALSRLRSTIVFDPSGVTAGANLSVCASPEVERDVSMQLNPDLVINSSEGFEDFLAYYLDRRDEVTPSETARLRELREQTHARGRRTETYRSIPVTEVVDVLQTS